MAETKAKVITLDELKAHSKKEDLYVLLSGKGQWADRFPARVSAAILTPRLSSRCSIFCLEVHRRGLCRVSILCEARFDRLTFFQHPGGDEVILAEAGMSSDIVFFCLRHPYVGIIRQGRDRSVRGCWTLG